LRIQRKSDWQLDLVLNNFMKRIFLVITFLVCFFMLFGENDLLSIMLVGDVMPGTDYPSERYLPESNGENLISDAVKERLLSSDVLCGNLEGCLLDGGMPSKRKKGKFLFRIPEKLDGVFTEAGFDLLSVANNHSGDFGDAGRISTQDRLDNMGIGYAGYLEKPCEIIERTGFRIGFVALAPFRGCLSHWQKNIVEAIIDSLSEETDLIIASMHYGGEGEKFVHLTGEDEIYYGENRGNPVKVAHWLVDSGVDLIYGHGPHVPRAMEIYKGKLIAYSLGNFVTWARFNLEGEYRPLAPILQVYYNKEGDFRYGEIISCRQNYHQGVDLDAGRSAARKVRKLSDSDIANSRLRYLEDDNGYWFYGI